MMSRSGSASERASLRRSLNLPRPLAHDAFENQARQTPDAVAVVCGGRSLCYHELDAWSRGLAGQLRSLGVGPECLVGLMLPRSAEMVASLLAILRAGGAFVPFDPGYPHERLRFMLADARPRWVVTHGGLAHLLRPQLNPVWQSGDGLIVLGDSNPSALREFSLPHRHRAPPGEGSRLAYAIYTSGSTGDPKAALLTHGGLANLIAAQRGLLRLRPGRRVLQFASLAFDAAVWEIFGALSTGATLVLAEADELLPGESLRRTIEAKRIDTLTVPPSVLAMLGSPGPPGLETLIVAGEACPGHLASQWSVGRRLINAYGPTEATICATTYECPSGDQPAPPLGDPLPGIELFVLNRDRQPVAEGEPGELCLAGPGLARGYLNRPELTAEKFVRQPLAGRDVRLYRTGDLVRRRADGELDFLGRVDRQVKIRGVRIEPDEVSEVLARHPELHATAVLVAQNPPRLAAFAIPRAGSSVSAGALRGWLQARLPAALIPSSLTLVTHWPLTPNGKLDERGLLALEDRGIGTVCADQRSGRFARTPLPSSSSSIHEREIAELFGQLLHVPHVLAEDDFFELGGNSLQAAELLACLKRRYGRSLLLGELLANSKVATLARRLLDETDKNRPAVVVPLQPKGTLPPWFVVHPAGGSVVCYRRLARELGRDRPCYGIQSPGLESAEPPPDSIETMAERYLHELSRVQPRGECLLAGWSLGGVVAYEMAHRLRAAGRHVRALVLIDAGILFSFKLLRRYVTTDDVPPFLWSQADRERMFSHLCRHAGQKLIPSNADEELARRSFGVFWANVEAAYQYSPPNDDGPMTLIVGQDAQGKYHAYREWSRSCGAIDVHEVPARHLELLEPPHVEQLARIIRSKVDHT
ncbi:MAG TPA: amino acid adenylation domain-containing protein [Pirellulales bacterium]|nr:amino acid adenylation domain-containing protein [Pirellulales bacterium]